MIGLHLQERMKPGAGSDVPAFTRMECLTDEPVAEIVQCGDAVS
jgi:hypothetical protein